MSEESMALLLFFPHKTQEYPQSVVAENYNCLFGDMLVNLTSLKIQE